MIEKKFLNTISKFSLLKRKDKVLLGISGGPDSVCMLHLFKKIEKDLRLDLICLHFNHSLRKSADKEEEFVKDLCSDLSVKCVTFKKDVNKFAKGDSLEQTARLLRLDFFLNSARRLKAKKIAIAHNKDDVAETVMMRIIRGTALKGLRAIQPSSKYRSLNIVRPLLDIRKKDILSWLEVNKFVFKVDESNLDDRFFRNKIRHNLLPLLEKEYNPNITGTLASLARLSALDYDFLHKFSVKEFSRIKKVRRDCIKLDLAKLTQMHAAVALNVIRLAIEEVKGDLRRLEFRHLEEILDLMKSRPDGSIVDLPNIEASKDGSFLSIKLSFE